MCLFGESLPPGYWLLPESRRWPPLLPGGLLTGHLYPFARKPRNQWGAEDWREYAEFLEESGAAMKRDLVAARLEVYALRNKLRRKRGPPTPPAVHGTLLTGLVYPPKPKRGRRPSEDTRREAREVMAIREELERGGGRVTDRQALEEWCARNGQRRSRALNNLRITNEISRIRREEAE